MATKRRRVKKQVSRSAIRKHNKRRPISGLEKAVHEMLKAEGIPFRREKPIGECHVDIFIEPNIVVELQGCHWHACQVCSKGPMTAAERRKIMTDAARQAFLHRSGYDVIAVWNTK